MPTSSVASSIIQLLIRNCEESSQKEIDQPGYQNRFDYAALPVEDQHRNSISELFDHCGDDQWLVTPGFPRDNQKCDLPRDRHTDEPIIVLGMVDRRRVVHTILGF